MQNILRRCRQIGGNDEKRRGEVRHSREEGKESDGCEGGWEEGKDVVYGI